MIKKLKKIALAITLIGLGTIWSPFIMKSIQGNNSEAEMTQARAYEVIGDRSGQVIVKDKATGEVIYKFQMEKGVVVREILLLENEKTVVASQKDRAAFWDLETGRQLATFPQRIYGFCQIKIRHKSCCDGRTSDRKGGSSVDNWLTSWCKAT